VLDRIAQLVASDIDLAEDDATVSSLRATTTTAFRSTNFTPKANNSLNSTLSSSARTVTSEQFERGTLR
jgi:hypothetical protein